MSGLDSPLGPSATQEYAYDPLPDGNFVRYIILQPGSGEEPLHCALHTTSLDAIPEFEAISYVWGTATKSHVAFCQGQKIPITSSLQNALRQVRLADGPRTLWADSICINQTDRKEQGRQVALMGEVYSRAKRTLICLGDASNSDAHQVTSLMTTLEDRMKVTLANVNTLLDVPSLDGDDPINSHVGWDSISTLLGHPWFRRLWVVQEAALPRETILHWGVARINWISFTQSFLWVLAVSPSLQRHLGGLGGIHLAALRFHGDLTPPAVRNHAEKSKLPLIEIFREGRSFEATDGRDYIYAMLGLVRHEQKQLPLDIRPDYEKPLLEVYCDFAKEFFAKTGDPDLLRCVVHDNTSLSTNNPSWVPFVNSLDDGWPGHINHLIPLRSKSGTISKPIVLAGDKICVRGVIFDEVQLASSPVPGNDTEAILLRAARAWNSFTRLKIKSAYHPNTQPRTFAQTLGNFSAPAGYMGQYQSLLDRFLFELHERGAEFDEAVFSQIKASSKSATPYLYAEWVLRRFIEKSFIVTKRGYFGLGSSVAEEGDLCCIIFGATVPFLLRKTELPGEYKLVGPAPLWVKQTTESNRVAGLLGTEQFKEWTSWDLDEQDIIIR